MDERVWTDEPLTIEESLQVGDSKISLVSNPAFAYFVTGNLEKVMPKLGLGKNSLGFGSDRKGAENFAVRINRNTILAIVNEQMQSGWNEGGFAVSEASDAYMPIKISGPQMAQILAQCGIADIDQASSSAATLFAGVTSLVIRNKGACEVWVPAAYLTYVSSYLRGVTL